MWICKRLQIRLARGERSALPWTPPVRALTRPEPIPQSGVEPRKTAVGRYLYAT